MRTDWIEVAKTDSGEVTFLRSADIFQHILDNGLGSAVGARNLTIWLILRTTLLFTIDGRTRRKDNIPAFVLKHAFEKRDG